MLASQIADFICRCNFCETVIFCGSVEHVCALVFRAYHDHAQDFDSKAVCSVDEAVAHQKLRFRDECEYGQLRL